MAASAPRIPARLTADASSSASPKKIDRFDVEPAREPVAGADLNFSLHGSPGGKANIRIAGAKGALFLEEERAYTGHLHDQKPGPNRGQ